MGFETLLGAAIGIKLVNGKIKPKFGFGAILATLILVLFFIGFLCALIYGLITLNSELIVMPAIAVIALGYALLISPFTQRSSNYHIEFPNENSLEGFKLSYKGKLVNIKHKIDKEGKIAFANNSSKTSCVSYADGTPMSNLTKYRIINYFIKWLSDNKLMSSDVTCYYE